MVNDERGVAITEPSSAASRERATVIHIKAAPEGWQNDPQYVYIGRAGKGFDGYFGNPYRLGPKMSRGSTLQAFYEYADERAKIDAEYRRRVRELHGKTLVCFCKPHACHGDVLAALAAQLAAQAKSGASTTGSSQTASPLPTKEQLEVKE